MNQISNTEEYIAQLPEERKGIVERLRNVIKENLPDGFKETISYGMIGFVVPFELYPAGYHCKPKVELPFVNIASQKHYISLYHMGLYVKPELMEWFKTEYTKYCKTKLDMGKSCMRFKKMNDIPYELIAELSTKITVNEWIKCYETQFRK